MLSKKVFLAFVLSISVLTGNIFMSCSNNSNIENSANTGNNEILDFSEMEKMEETEETILNILNYGAAKNGEDDDTAAFQSVFQDCPSGGKLTLPEGVYVLSESLSCAPYSTITGAGSGKTVIKFRGENSEGCVLKIGDGAHGVTISGITIDFESGSGADRGILVSNSDDVVISDVEIRNMGNEGQPIGPIGIHFNGSENGRISNCKFENIGAETEWGCGIRLSHGSSHTVVEANTINKTGRGGILCDNNSTNLVIKNNTVTECGLFSEGLGIELWGGCGYSIVEDNVVDHWLSIDSSDYSAIRRNVVSDTSGKLKYLGLELVNTCYFVFTDNTVDHGAYIGLSESNVGPKNFGYWGYNDIKGCAQWGVQIQGEEGGSRYRYFYKNSFTDTYDDKDPIYPGDAGHGIRINDNANDFVFDNCTIKDNKGLAFQILGNNVSNIAFINGNVENNKNNAIPKTVDKEIAVLSAAIDCPDEVRAGEEVVFAAKSGDGETIVKYVLWDFNDGLPASDINAKHTYDAPGNYRVTLIIWDDSGKSGFAEKYIKVL
jgi:PKD repeat protein